MSKISVFLPFETFSTPACVEATNTIRNSAVALDMTIAFGMTKKLLYANILKPRFAR
jgi:hypothetical protein